MKKRVILITFITLVVTLLLQNIPSWASAYSTGAYPIICRILSTVSNLVRFSLYDLLITGLIGMSIFLLFKLLFAPKRLATCAQIGLFAAWIYIAFYLSWGTLYFAPSFAWRNQLPTVQKDSVVFEQYFDKYIGELNEHYAQAKKDGWKQPSEGALMEELQGAYDQLQAAYTFVAPLRIYDVKPSLYSRIYAMVGVRGYFGPFTGESMYNTYALPYETPAIKAHELAHRIGITSEAEANLIGYLLTTKSSDAFVQFSGYFSVLSYLLGDAYHLLNEERYRAYIGQIDPQIIELYQQRRKHWNALYSHTLGEYQEKLYNHYLQSNNIHVGTRDYSRVVNLLLSLEQEKIRSYGFANQPYTDKEPSK